ncbi:hypothetical protein RB195_011420 [Necator americanus]|uniref:C2H2-type domain-containing protein n=1 Tax=Necator americanus TaxID=51031 RepID=A0ABR1D3G6_NECAM
MRKKARSSKPISETPKMSCPICDEGFMHQECKTYHCEDVHSKSGANRKAEEYTALVLTFDTTDEFEVEIAIRVPTDRTED